MHDKLPSLLFPPTTSAATQDCDCACEVALPPPQAITTPTGLWQQAAEA